MQGPIRDLTVADCILHTMLTARCMFTLKMGEQTTKTLQFILRFKL